MMASTVADNVSRRSAPLSANLGSKPRCLRARSRMMASAYTYALRAAAEGAALAYAEVTGETWKAYEAPMPASAGVSRRGAAVEMAAFQTA